MNDRFRNKWEDKNQHLKRSSPYPSLQLAFFFNLIYFTSFHLYTLLLFVCFFCLFCCGLFFSLLYCIFFSFASLAFQITHYSWSFSFYSFYSDYILSIIIVITKTMQHPSLVSIHFTIFLSIVTIVVKLFALTLCWLPIPYCQYCSSI